MNWRRNRLAILIGVILGLASGMWFNSMFHRRMPVQPAADSDSPPAILKPRIQAKRAAQGMSKTEFEMAIRKAIASPVQERRINALSLLAESINASDIAQLAPYLIRHPDWEVGRHLTTALFRRWASMNPDSAWNCAQAIPQAELRLATQSSILGEWAKQDPVSALEKINREIGGTGNVALKTALLESLAEADPKRAMSLAEADAVNAKALRNAVIMRWSENDPAAAAAAAVAMPGRNIEVLATIARAWASRDPSGALAWVKTLSKKNPLGSRIGDLILAIGWTNPALAADYLRGMPGGLLRNAIMRKQVYVMGLYNLQEASQWLEQFPDDPDRREVQITLVKEWARFDPKAAIQCGAQLPASPQRTQLLSEVAKIWEKTEPLASCTWVAQLPDTADRSQLLLDLVRAWVRQAPADSGAFVSGLPAGSLQDEAVVAVLARWTEVDANAAVSWVSQFPEGNTRDKSLCSVIDAWSKSDPDAAGNWIKALKNGPTRDKALASYVERLAQSHNPATAIDWAKDIKEDALRVRTIETTARTWLYRDVEAARAWVAASSLPELSKQQLLGTKP